MLAGDRVIVYHKADVTHPDPSMREFVKPPYETTYANLKDYEALNGKIIKEIVPADTQLKKKVIAPIPNIKTIIDVVEKPITDESIVKYLLAKGKTPLSIAKYLELDFKVVTKISESELVA